MKAFIPSLLTFALALMLAVPAIQAVSSSEAEARPGRMLGESRQSGKREHKKAKSDDDDSSSNRNRRRTTRSGTNQSSTPTPQGDAQRTGRTRPAGTSQSAAPQNDARPTGRTRPASGATQTTTRTRTHTRSSAPRRTRHTSSTTVHHHHHHEERRRTYHEPAPATAEGFLTFGVGMGAFASNEIVDGALPGTHLNVALGAKGRVWGMELGFNGAGYKFDPDLQGVDLSVMGLSGDLKFQPSFGVIEPFALVGLGGYVFQDAIMQEMALGGAFRMGFGLDLRFASFALGGRYLYSVHGFSNEAGLYQNLAAQTEALSLNMTFYF